MLSKFKTWLPTRENIETNPEYKFLRKYIHDTALFEFNRNSVSKAVFIGMFVAFLPMPFQTVVSAMLAVFLRSNLIISLALVWVSNPFTMVPILYISYLMGSEILGIHSSISINHINADMLMSSWNTLFLPVLVGAIIDGLICGAILATFVWLFYSLFKTQIKNVKNKG